MDSHQASKAALITALIIEGWIFEKDVIEGLAARDGRTSVRHVQGIYSSHSVIITMFELLCVIARSFIVFS